jgi:hypothetical protein
MSGRPAGCSSVSSSLLEPSPTGLRGSKPGSTKQRNNNDPCTAGTAGTATPFSARAHIALAKQPGGRRRFPASEMQSAVFLENPRLFWLWPLADCCSFFPRLSVLPGAAPRRGSRPASLLFSCHVVLAWSILNRRLIAVLFRDVARLRLVSQTYGYRNAGGWTAAGKADGHGRQTDSGVFPVVDSDSMSCRERC